MRFSLQDIEKGGMIKPPKKKKKKPVYTHIPDEEIPYQRKNFSQFIDRDYDTEGE